MKLVRIVKSMIVKGILGALLGAAAGFVIGFIMCTAPLCKGCVNYLGTEAKSIKGGCISHCLFNIIWIPAGGFCYVMQSDEADINLGAYSTVIYGAVIGAVVGAIYGITSAFSDMKKERDAGLQRIRVDNYSQLQQEAAGTASEINQIVEQTEKVFGDVANVYDQEYNQTRALVQKYTTHLLKVKQTAELIQKEMGERKEDGNL